MININAALLLLMLWMRSALFQKGLFSIGASAHFGEILLFQFSSTYLAGFPDSLHSIFRGEGVDGDWYRNKGAGQSASISMVICT